MHCMSGFLCVSKNLTNYPYTIFVLSKIMKMNSGQQNKVDLYLFNSINFKIKN